MLLKNTENLMREANNQEDKDIMSDIRYICKSCSLITESLQKGCDVLQMPNGDIIVSELKAVTFQYTWDDKKGKLLRSQVGSKNRKIRLRKNTSSNKELENFDSEKILESIS